MYRASPSGGSAVSGLGHHRLFQSGAVRMPRLDPAWLDVQYNNRARIPDHQQLFDRWSRDSAIARDRSSRRLDVAYGPGPAETLDVFPSTRADAPVLFFIHGGYWRALDKRDVSFIGPSFTRE